MLVVVVVVYLYHLILIIYIILYTGLDGDECCQTWKTATTQLRYPLPHDQRVTAIVYEM